MGQRKFLVRNWTSDLRIPRSNALSLNQRDSTMSHAIFFFVSHLRVREKEIFPLFLTELRIHNVSNTSSFIKNHPLLYLFSSPQPGLSMITLGNEINWYQFIKIDNNSSMSQATNQWFMDKGNSCNCHHDLTATVDFYRLLYIFRIGSLESSILISKGQ